MPAVSVPLRTHASTHARDDLAGRGVEGAHGAADGGLWVLPGIRGPPGLPTSVARTHPPLSDELQPRERREWQGCFAARDCMKERPAMARFACSLGCSSA